MGTRQVVVIILLALIVGLAVISWGAAGGQGQGSDETSEQWLKSLQEAMPSPKPTRAAEVSSTSQCLKGSGGVRTARFSKTCKVTIAARDGAWVRKLHVVIEGSTPVDLTFVPNGDLPGEPKKVRLPRKDDDETIRETDYYVPEDGADLDLSCAQADETCVVRLDELMP